MRVKELLTSNPEILNEKDNAGWTALHEASCNGHPDIARELLDAGADVNMPNHENVTALHEAVLYRHVGVVEVRRALEATPVDSPSPQVLLEFGASITARNIRGRTPVDEVDDEEIAKRLQEV